MPGINKVAHLEVGLTILEQIDEIADRFEAEWKAGKPPEITDYIAFVPPEIRVRVLNELIALDRDYRKQFGLDPLPADHWKQFSEWFVASTARESAEDYPNRAAFPQIDNYEILEQIGCGGMGTVYRARQIRPDRVLAIKVIRNGNASNSREATRLLAEAEAIAQIQHPNIVQIYEVGEQYGFPFFSMELAEGGNLASQLAGRPQPPDKAAKLVEIVARAIHCSHEHGIVHRDLKPANVLLTRDSIPKISDFGLAKRLESPTGQTLSGAILGTPAYMAPEQAGGKTNEMTPAVDTYAIGVMLYEMLTGSPPFRGATPLDTLEQVRNCEPVPPRRLTPKIPRDLETICLKAMSKEPQRRYPSAWAMAEDLARFQRGEPIQARPLGPLARCWRWCRRKPSWAALAFTCVLLVLAIVVGAIGIALEKTANERDRRREAIVQRLQLVRTGSHSAGWSNQASDLINQAQQIRGDLFLRNQAAACYEGLDAQLLRHIENEGVSWVALDRTGSRLLAGGRNDSRGRPSSSAQLWDDLETAPRTSDRAGAGPVVFGRDGKPLVLIPHEGTLKLGGIDGNDPEFQFAIAANAGSKARIGSNSAGLPLLAIDANANLVAAGLQGADDDGQVIVRDSRSGMLLLQQQIRPAALAVSPGGALVAAIHNNRLMIWTLNDGKQFADVPLTNGTSLSLAFSPDERQLAIGTSSGTVQIWDLRLLQPVVFCQGCRGELHAIAFSPDGTLLAGAGRGPAMLWNAASGQALLRLSVDGLATSISFSSGADKLAISTTSPGSIYLWEIQENRGVRTLRGLASSASNMCFSADGAKLAALSSNRKAAIWDVAQGRLSRLFDMPAWRANLEPAMALSANGELFACSAGGTVQLWDIAAGREIGSWQLPIGIGEAVAFHPSGFLASLSFETERASSHPASPQLTNGLCTGRLRHLTPGRPPKLVHEFSSFNHRFFRVTASPDGKVFLAEGTSISSSGPVRTLDCIDSLAGKAHWSVQSRRTALVSDFIIDSGTKRLVARLDNQLTGQVLDLATGQPSEMLETLPLAMTDDYWVTGAAQSDTEPSAGFAVRQRGEKDTLIILGIDRAAPARPLFSPNGQVLAWANDDGTISVCNLDALRSKLAQTNLGW